MILIYLTFIYTGSHWDPRSHLQERHVLIKQPTLQTQ